jgi:hypothetical protein
MSIGEELSALGNDVERWLSFLADPAPWLSDTERQRNIATFAEVADTLAEILVTAQTRAAVNDPSAWLVPLVRYWDATRATVITFNYDCLVELAYLDAMKGARGRLALELYPVAITPLNLRTAGIYACEDVATLQLLKLHGSLSWFYSGLDATPTDAIYDAGIYGGYRDGIKVGNEESTKKLLADKVPFIVPPTAAKSPFYSNRILRALWVRAADALHTADELVVMGYSAPVSDLTVQTLVSTSFCGSAVVPVNSDERILDRLTRFLNPESDVRVVKEFIGNENVLERWVENHTKRPD